MSLLYCAAHCFPLVSCGLLTSPFEPSFGMCVPIVSFLSACSFFPFSPLSFYFSLSIVHRPLSPSTSSPPLSPILPPTIFCSHSDLVRWLSSGCLSSSSTSQGIIANNVSLKSRINRIFS
ncbi:uncharacterized protein EI90DRAFT_2710751 [Cantharellus anzutake]|uniref:uncharacterized protein n=1 Tax=Cantharellus anzutake TaxID=1750568 RepID=UPI0019035DEB|nr:uncharacterized protein EI90DRAFT_549689 [Cantharellus anzutake]XP_038909688.1 uncharacterized protein EI90DRAFT_2710751 [Cantharellus anzutake]KAF8313527.1 hypothetical protein EI90DRAFT_549689 [Cantharellus anzutake]KAF8318319.1 hypothetical protein EI90DRAFT_2710751 [Cantharellus anzutake]